LAVSLLGHSSLAAQRWVALEAGGGALAHQFAPASEAVLLAPRLAWITPGFWLHGGGLYSRGTALRWNAEADLNAGAAWSIGGNWSLGLDASGGWSAHHDQNGTSEYRLLPSLRFEPRGVSLRVMLGAGQASTPFAAERFAVGMVEGVGRLGPLDVSGRVSRTGFTDPVIRATEIWIPNGPSADTALRRHLRHFNDVEMRAGWSLPRLRLEAGIQRRLALDGFHATGWHAQATGWLTPDLAIFAASGRTLSRLTVDLPARRYTTLGLRWVITSRRAGPASPEPASRARGFRAERLAETVRLLMPANGEDRVDIMGDFTEWEPVAMKRSAAGWWVLTRGMHSGLYRITVRVNGGPWMVPPGLPSEDDGLGGRSGLLLVP
jgi:hypothetical protein